MPIEVDFEGTVHEFPDDFTDADIAAALGGPRKVATPPPSGATIGMLAPSTREGDPKRTAPIEGYEWAGMAPAEKMRNVMEWGGNAVSNLFIPPTLSRDAQGQRTLTGANLGTQARQHPYITAAEVLGPPVIQKAASVVPGVLAKATGLSKQRGGANMQAALEAGKELRVPLNQGAQDAAMRARELTGSRNAELNAFFDRLTNPKVTMYRGDDLAVREAQDFVTKFGAMSADDASKLPPVAQRELRTLATELRAALTASLDDVGAGAQYTKGVREYRRAAKAAELWEKAKPMLRKLGYAAAAGAGYRGLSSEPER